MSIICQFLKNPYLLIYILFFGKLYGLPENFFKTMKKLFFGIMTLFTTMSYAQIDSLKQESPLKISGYADVYYSYDFGNPSHHNRPNFMYAYQRHNEVNLNLGMIKASYNKENVRANIALGTGTYMNVNYAAESGVLKNIYEANIGVKLSKSKDIWLDAGILPSHIGWESAIGTDCWTLTRSIAAENSPYFETGARISYTSDNGKLYLAGLVLNGWQRIQKVDGNNSISFGHQLTYKFNDKISINSSSFIGNDKTDSLRQMRYFHDLYANFQLNEKWALLAGFDIGVEQKEKASSRYNCWYSPVLMGQFTPNEKSRLSARLEYYNDKNGVMIPTETKNGFQTFGYSINYDYKILDNVMWRVEARGLSSKDRIFEKDNQLVPNNYFVTTSLAVSF